MTFQVRHALRLAEFSSRASRARPAMAFAVCNQQIEDRAFVERILEGMLDAAGVCTDGHKKTLRERHQDAVSMVQKVYPDKPAATRGQLPLTVERKMRALRKDSRFSEETRERCESEERGIWCRNLEGESVI